MANPVEGLLKINTGDDSSGPVILKGSEDTVPCFNQEVIDARALDPPELRVTQPYFRF